MSYANHTLLDSDTLPVTDEETGAKRGLVQGEASSQAGCEPGECVSGAIFSGTWGAPFDHQSPFYYFFFPSPESKIDCRLSLIRVNFFSFPYYVLNQSRNYVASLPESANYLPHCCRARPLQVRTQLYRGQKPHSPHCFLLQGYWLRFLWLLPSFFPL